jgi:hypothetical protein
MDSTTALKAVETCLQDNQASGMSCSWFRFSRTRIHISLGSVGGCLEAIVSGGLKSRVGIERGWLCGFAAVDASEGYAPWITRC